MTTLSLDTLNSATPEEFVAALGDIFEHSPWAAEAVYPARPFGSLAALLEAMVAAVRAADPDHRRKLLAVHPDLAGKAARAKTLTAASTAEQASAGLDRLTEGEYADFHRLNDAYRQKHGIPFIVCVRRHTKASILRQFERRLANDPATEQKTALDEVFRIAALRLDQRVAAADRLPLSGRLSTHVLDTHGGTPAQGIPLTLVELGPGEARRVVATAVTNRDGRTDQPLIAGRPVPIGTYELVFEVAAHFSARGVPLPDPPFLDAVPIRFSVAEAEGHYHVPLLVTPWSFSTYRGS
ncbi:2-oxo-4-hydroxy-4-carboxy-5-ureidoimidazoline decarboxylase [Rhodoplanes roseus]|uniref:OHCU decarboxylase n=1 Tax=Rhodoplanes roseus TaxID=29409 RepID=A0A327KHH6_9BRAD|nr:2-oxo-4-hydroxy-4-carboxy-5-ureidoimidazoline decarboxylase [Rhodoplanes roseus]RAI37897.1 OHCU decarboxylase [Rhodoplanes roseus]